MTLSLKYQLHTSMDTNRPEPIFDSNTLEFHASCSEGLSDLLSEEVESYGLKIISSNRGGVYFKGRKESVLQFILNTGISSRVAFTVDEFRARSEEEIYYLAKRFSWEKILTSNTKFRIESYAKGEITNSQYALYKLKDAIMDRAREKGSGVPEIDRDNPDVLILLRNNRDNIKLQVAVTTAPLNQRGYRIKQHKAPIKETIAQTIIRFSGWDRKSVLIDPMCGSGTILIEAALLTGGKPLNGHIKDSLIFKKLFGKIELNDEAKEGDAPLLFGYDIDPENIEIARTNAAAAGVDHLIEFQTGDVRNLENPGKGAGVIISNPPYGVRLGSKEEMQELYKDIGRVIKDKFEGFTFTVISGDTSLLGYFKLKAEKSLSLKLAGLKGKIVNYSIRKPV